jgi:transposase
MTKEKLIQYINKGFLQQKIANTENVGRTVVKGWLKKFNLTTKRTDLNKKYSKMTESEKAQAQKTAKALRASKRKNERRRSFIEKLGGCCEICGYSEIIDILEFHHNNPTEKEFTISDDNMHLSNEILDSEIQKCSLLCPTCHREEYYKIRDSS